MAAYKKKVTVKKPLSLPTLLLRSGVVLIAAGLTILFLTFIPILFQEIKYNVRVIQKTELTPVDRDFGIVIPKLGANAHVIANVDPYDSRTYQQALTKGVAHARGTAVPGAMGNIFLFAHSSEDFYNAMRYNSVFYLLNKMETNDEIDLYYKNIKYTYTVTGKKLVNAKDVSYLENGAKESTLTLMTCWPPGTNVERLLIFASLKRP